MRINRIDQILEKVEKHVSKTSTAGTEIESLLAQSLLVIACAEFEREIESIIKEKCLSIPDESLRVFIGSCVDAVFRSVRSSELAGLLNRFGPTFKNAFNRRAEEQQIAITFYNNIVINRHGGAHAGKTNTTFPGIQEFL
jgi:hypothetical protein